MKITPNQYAKTLYELTQERSQSEIGDVISQFADLLAKKNQTKLLPKIIEKFADIWNKKNGIVEAEVISREKMSNELSNDVSKYVSNKYGAKEVLIKSVVNESIKGGIIIRVGDEVLDASIERQLRDLRIQLER